MPHHPRSCLIQAPGSAVTSDLRIRSDGPSLHIQSSVASPAHHNRFKHRWATRLQAAADQIALHAASSSVVLNPCAWQRRHTGKSDGAAVHTARAPLSSAAAPPHRNHVITPHDRMKTSRGRANSSCMRQKPPSCLINSAIASAATPANPVAAVHTARAPLSSAAAPAHRNRAKAPQDHIKTSRRAANGSRVRQESRLCLTQQLPAPPHLRIRWQLCTQHAPRSAAPLHPRTAIMS